MDNHNNLQDELTLKELILAIQDYTRYFLRKWFWFVLGAVVVGGLFFYIAFTEPVVYPAPLTFVMNNEQNKGVGAGAILGSLGLGKDDGGGKAMQLLEMAKSRRLLGKVLFDSVTVDGKHQFVADHLIELYDYHTRWEDSEQKAGFLFEGVQPAPNDRVANSIFKDLHVLLINEEDGLLMATVDESSGVFEIRTATIQPELSIYITEGVYQALKDYFIKSITSGKQQTVEQLRLRADSIRQELIRAEALLARFQDKSRTITLRSNSSEGIRLQREVLILSSMYAEIVKNRETAAFLLANERPAFSVIDGPLEPLRAKRESLVRAVGIGAMLGVLLLGAILFFTKFVSDALRN